MSDLKLYHQAKQTSSLNSEIKQLEKSRDIWKAKVVPVRKELAEAQRLLSYYKKTNVELRAKLAKALSS